MPTLQPPDGLTMAEQLRWYADMMRRLGERYRPSAGQLRKWADEVERLRVALAEARATIAAEQGLPEGAPSEGWFSGPGGWHRNGNCGQDVALCVREDVTDPVDWNVWPDDAAVSEPMAQGQADTYREAMKAADAALEARNA